MTERDTFIRICRALESVPYHWGGRDASGLDCSGLVALALHGATDGRLNWVRSMWCQRLWEVLPPVLQASARPGDLALYGRDGDNASHVMVLMPDGRVFGASGGGRDTTKTNARPDQRVQYRGGPAYRTDLLGFRRMPLDLATRTTTPTA